MVAVASTAGSPAPSRREQILAVAAQLFAQHGFHGVSIAELGAAVGVSGPALYRHFPGKEALLSELLIDISERLLAGGRERVTHTDPRGALGDLVDFHVEFATREPELIVVQDRDLANLPAEARHTVRRLQRTYAELWVDTLRRVHPDVAPEVARTVVHGVFGLLNSTPYAPAPSGAGADSRVSVLRRMAVAALDAG
ncbi:SACE_7040 family transcriptional regulator [Pseudonocardia phyllosphaerae]|uniref:SACE_7040 family transcriptional regulator n=1 Tax=Pseudonocardia phyllosphaerae TaxID=3390502 RepID=UPI00397AB3D0